jgi:alpha-galactosidase
MAAPAGLPEFAGNVAAVRTEVYWDKELSAAKAKEQMVRGEAKRRVGAGEKVDVEALLKDKLSERERTILEKGISNLEFHYLGSAKILGGVGKGLAEAMVRLRSGGEAK